MNISLSSFICVWLIEKVTDPNPNQNRNPNPNPNCNPTVTLYLSDHWSADRPYRSTKFTVQIRTADPPRSAFYRVSCHCHSSKYWLHVIFTRSRAYGMRRQRPRRRSNTDEFDESNNSRRLFPILRGHRPPDVLPTVDRFRPIALYNTNTQASLLTAVNVSKYFEFLCTKSTAYNTVFKTRHRPRSAGS